MSNGCNWSISAKIDVEFKVKSGIRSGLHINSTRENKRDEFRIIIQFRKRRLI
jgi:hypothetical protein